jgi:hypothetical protein
VGVSQPACRDAGKLGKLVSIETIALRVPRRKRFLVVPMLWNKP